MVLLQQDGQYTGNCMSKINNIETLEQGGKYVQSKQQRYQNDAIGVVVFIVNLGHVSHLALVFLSLTLSW